MQKSAKFILPLLLTAALLFGFTGCADKNETPTNPTTEAATAESTAAPTTPVILQAPVMETEDWDAYTPTKYQDKEHLSVTLNLTADLTAQDTILYQDGNKYAELVGVIVPAKGTGTLPSGTRYTYIMSDLPTETGSWYAYCYALPAGDNLLLLTLYKTEKQAALSPADAALLQSAQVG